MIAGLAMLLPLRLATYRLAPIGPSRLGMIYIRLLLWGLRIKVYADGPLASEGLIIANHISWTDILILGSCQQAAFVAKSEVRGWPLLGLLARMHGTLFVQREGRGSAQRQVAALAAVLARGPVILFPEGTTGNGAQVLPFRPTLFAAAAGRTVQPVAIIYRPRNRKWAPGERAAFAWDGDKPFWPHLLTIAAAGPVDCRIVTHRPIRTASADRKELAAACHRIVCDAHANATSNEDRD